MRAYVHVCVHVAVPPARLQHFLENWQLLDQEGHILKPEEGGDAHTLLDLPNHDFGQHNHVTTGTMYQLKPGEVLKEKDVVRAAGWRMG